MLQPEALQLRTEGRDEQQERRLSESEEGNNPFSFTPQIIRLHKDHELFEVTKHQETEQKSRQLLVLLTAVTCR